MGLTDLFQRNKMMTRTCTECGKKIEVPAGLSTFACVYCGARMTLQARPEGGMMPVKADAYAEDTAEYNLDEERAYAKAHLLDCVKNYQEYFKYFTKKDYPEHFQSYTRGVTDIFLAVDRAVRSEPERRDELIAEYVEHFLDEREAWHKADKHGKSRNGLNRLMFDSKLIIALYMVPAVYALNLSVSDAFVAELHSRYMKRYPGNPFQPGTYPEIVSGFRKSRLCFITTAVCESEGKPDDCAELQAFRAFRDGELSETAAGRALVKEYYRIAPPIVTCMRYADNCEAVCAELRRDYLTPCYEALGRGDGKGCRETYVRMVLDLKRRYGVS